ncbi:hypothetical protein [Emcibacter sp.]|uniref:hypothetical protein n=1 Tax=Emcibacter sp. TaxID=1979954 RepID=UPI003A91987F
MYVFPTDKQIEEFTESDPDQPVLMINLVRLRENAQYPENSDHGPCSGAKAFDTYVEMGTEIAEKVGGRILVGESIQNIFIGPEDEKWDRFYLIWYPSMRMLLDLLSSPEFIALTIHRTASVLDARMLKCDGSNLGL